VPVEQRVAKYLQISDFIKEELARGRWKPGEQLPPARTFVDQFDVTPVTVWKALDILGQEGLIHRVQGKGTYVSQPPSTNRTQLIGVATRTRGDSYGITFDALSRQLKSQKFSPVMLDMEDQPNLLHHDWEQHLHAILENDLQALIMDGASYQPFEFLLKQENKLPPLTFMRVFESELKFKRANMITSDWEAGGYLAASHMLEQGYDKLVYLTFGQPPQAPAELGPECYYNQQVKKGIDRALTEAGQKPQKDMRIILDVMDKQPDTKLGKALRDGYNGVICLGDVRALKVYRLASQMKRHIGKDIGVCGYFDTQWSNLLNVPLTSVQIHEQTIGQLAAQAVIEGWKGEVRKVQPELIIKESTQCGK
jgi:DNA-binding LacI/PurR family transcriptional regulator